MADTNRCTNPSLTCGCCSNRRIKSVAVGLQFIVLVVPRGKDSNWATKDATISSWETAGGIIPILLLLLV